MFHCGVCLCRKRTLYAVGVVTAHCALIMSLHLVLLWVCVRSLQLEERRVSALSGDDERGLYVDAFAEAPLEQLTPHGLRVPGLLDCKSTADAATRARLAIVLRSGRAGEQALGSTCTLRWRSRGGAMKDEVVWPLDRASRYMCCIQLHAMVYVSPCLRRVRVCEYTVASALHAAVINTVRIGFV